MPRLVAVRHAAVATGVAALAAFAAFAATAAPAGGSTPAKSAQDEYNAALNAAKNQSVHFSSDVTQGGVTLKVQGDAGGTSGTQTLNVNNGKQSEHMTAEVVGSTGYINGNSTALHNIIGLSSSQSTKYAGKWLSFPTSNQELAQLVSGLLKSQVSTELAIDGPYTYGSDSNVNGQQAKAVKGSVSTNNGGKVTEVIYVPTSGSPLPIQEITNPGVSAHSTDLHGTVSFSNWGEKVSVTAPSHSTSILKLAPTSTSGATSTTGG